VCVCVCVCVSVCVCFVCVCVCVCVCVVDSAAHTNDFVRVCCLLLCRGSCSRWPAPLWGMGGPQFLSGIRTETISQLWGQRYARSPSTGTTFCSAAHVCTQIHVSTDNAHTHMHTQGTHKNSHTHPHTHATHTYTHTHKHTNTHTHAQPPKSVHRCLHTTHVHAHPTRPHLQHPTHWNACSAAEGGRSGQEWPLI